MTDPMPDDRPVSPEERLREALRTLLYFIELPGGFTRAGGGEALAEAAAALSTPAGPSPEPAGIYDAEPAEPSEWSAPREEAVEALAVLDEARRQIMDEIRAGERRIDAAHLHHIDSFIRRVRRLSAARPSSPTPEETR